MICSFSVLLYLRTKSGILWFSGRSASAAEISCPHSRAYSFEPIALIFGLCINHGEISPAIDFRTFRTGGWGVGGGRAKFLVCTLELTVLNRLL